MENETIIINTPETSEETKVIKDYEIYVADKGAAADPDVMRKLDLVDQGKHPFSWCAFFLSPIYFLYRRCIKESIIYYILAFALNYVPYIGVLAKLAMPIIAGFLFYPIYRKRLAKLVETGADPEKTGGTLAVLTLILVMLAFLVPLAISVMFL